MGSGTRLRQRLLRQFLLLAIVPLAALSALAVLVMVPALMDNAEQRNRLLSGALRDQVQQQLAARQRVAQLFAGAMAGGRVSDSRIDPALASMLATDAFVQAAYVTDAQGLIRHLALPPRGGLNTADLIGLDQSRQPHYQRARASGQPQWSETFLSLLTSRITAVLVVPAGERSVILEISLDELSQALAATGAAGSVHAMVLDRAGRVIGHPQARRAQQQESMAQLPLVQDAVRGQPGRGRVRIDGVDSIAEILPVAPTGWSVLVAEPTASVLAPLLRLGWVLAACLLVTAATAASLAWWLARRSGAEVGRLTAAALAAVDDSPPAHDLRFDTAEFAELWTRLKNLFERLRERDAQTEAARRDLQAVLDAATEVAIVTTQLDGTVRLFSAGAQKMLGWREADVVGRVTPAHWHDGDEIVRRAAQIARQRGQTIDGVEALFALSRVSGLEVRDWTLLRADGSRLDASVAVTAMRAADGDITGFLVVAIDITQRRRAAELDVARRAAEGASQAKSDFLSRMSHELRSPLNAMLGYAQLLEVDRHDPLTTSQAARARQIQHAGWHLVQLIDDVLDLARIESGRMRVSIEPVDAAKVVQRACEMAEPQLRQLGVTLHVRWGGASHSAGVAPLAADPTRLTQVLVNLLSNAAKYNRPGGSVELVCEPLPARQVALRVRDTGRGMTEQQLARLFEPFNRLGQESSGIEGTGIGLVITRHLVQLMNGELRVTSRPGEGSEFTVVLREAEAPPAAAELEPAAIESPPPLQPARIVYIEDSAVNATLMRELLRQRPHVVLEVSPTAGDGLARLREAPPDLLLLDMHLPDATGDEVIDALARDRTLSGLPIVVVSADATSHRIAAALNRGVRAYLTKPIDVVEALATIDGVLAGRSTARPAPLDMQ